jgi:hypothetical protein
MDLQTWLPGLLLLGLAIMGSLFALIAACDRI